MVAVGSQIGALGEQMSPEAQSLIKATDDQFTCLAELNFTKQWWRYFDTPIYRRFCNAEDKIQQLSQPTSICKF